MRWHWRDLTPERCSPVHVKRGQLNGDYPAHDHDFLEIMVVAAGTATHRHAGGEERLRAGDALVVRPHSWHAYHDAQLDYWDCCLPAEILRRELAWAAADPVLGRLLWSAPLENDRGGILLLHLPPAAHTEVTAQLDALTAIADAREPSSRATVLGRLLVLTGALASALTPGGEGPSTGSAHPAVLRALAILEEDPARDWPLADLAAEVGLAGAYLTRLFTAATGLPPRAWHIRQRLELAAGLLLRSELPVADIGAQVGWADANLFARRFRAQYGTSASTWRARYQSDRLPR